MDVESKLVQEPRFFTLRDVATYLSVSEPQVYALVRSGELLAMKIGGRGVWRVDRSKLEEFIKRMTEETAIWVRVHPFGRQEHREASQEC